MSSATHNDPSRTWLIIFFVCFTIAVGMIGLWAFFCYKVDAPVEAPAGGHGSMILPHDGEWAPHARIWPTV